MNKIWTTGQLIFIFLSVIIPEGERAAEFLYLRQRRNPLAPHAVAPSFWEFSPTRAAQRLTLRRPSHHWLFSGVSKTKNLYIERITDIYNKSYTNKCQKCNPTSLQLFEYYHCKTLKVAATNDAKVKVQHFDSDHEVLRGHRLRHRLS